MNNRVLNEVKRNRELMGLNESEVDEQLGAAIRQGIEKGKNFVKGLFNKNKPESDEGENENKEEPISTENYEQTVIKIYDDHITIEAETTGNREVAQKTITKTAEDKGYGQQKSRKVIERENGGYKVIATFDKK
mgnify:CR=1 FL=1